MKSMRSFSFVGALLLLLGALSFSPILAGAESSAAGRFTLPVEARWGTVTLPAGDYQYSVEYRGASTIVFVRGTAGEPCAMFLAHSIEPNNGAGKSDLVLTRKGDTMFVTSLHVKELGLTLDYTIPAVAMETVAARMSQPPVR